MTKPQRKRGRPKGSRNKATADIKALAQVHTPRAILILADIMEKSDSDPARVAAIKELFDRGHGKSAMAPEDAAKIDGAAAILAAVWARRKPADAA